MAGTAIGPLTLKIIANADVMSGVLNKVAGNVKRWSGAVASDVGKALSDPLGFVGDKVRSIPKVGQFLALPIDGIQAAAKVYTEGADRIKELGAASARTGIPMGDLKALMIAAGPASEMMDKAMFKLQQHVMDAARGSEKAKTAFQQLGIGTENIANVKTIDLMKQLADKFAALPGGAARASAAFAMFGKSGLAMLPMLAAGSERIARSQKMAEAFGLGASPQDLENIKRAGEGMKSLALFAEGVKNQITIGIAPVLAALAERMGRLGAGAKGWAAYVTSGIETVAVGMAYVYDVWDAGVLLGKTLWLGFKIGCGVAAVAILDFGAFAMESLGKVAQGLAKIVLIMAKIDPAQNLALKGLKAAGLDVEKMASDGAFAAAGGKTAKFLRDAAERGRGMLGEDQAKLLDAWATPNDSAVGKVRAFFERVRQLAADTGRSIGDAQAAAMIQWFPKADEIRRQLEGPLGVFREKMDELGQMWRSGVTAGFGIAGDRFAQMAGGAELRKLLQSAQVPEKRFAGAALRDSTDAYSAIVQHQFGDGNKSLQERLLDVAQQQRLSQEDQVNLFREYLDIVKANPDILPRGLS